MTMRATPDQPTIKTHGDKLAAAAGVRTSSEEPPPIAETAPPLKREGDKLSDAVGRAVGGSAAT